MGIGPFAEAGLAAVAYAHVLPNGTQISSSGVSTTWLGTGVYMLELPDGLGIESTECYPQIQSWGQLLLSSFLSIGNRRYLVTFVSISQSVDAEFTIVFLRTVTP